MKCIITAIALEALNMTNSGRRDQMIPKLFFSARPLRASDKQILVNPVVFVVVADVVKDSGNNKKNHNIT